LLTLACGNLAGGDLDRTIAIDILGSLTPELEEGDSLQLQARAVDARGDSVPDAVIIWAIVDTGDVGFTVDTSTGLIVASHPGTGRVVARTQGIRSGVLQVIVLPAPDSLAATTEQRLTVASSSTRRPSRARNSRFQRRRCIFSWSSRRPGARRCRASSWPRPTRSQATIRSGSRQ
jgi:hypothetical protein